MCASARCYDAGETKHACHQLIVHRRMYLPDTWQYVSELTTPDLSCARPTWTTPFSRSFLFKPKKNTVSLTTVLLPSPAMKNSSKKLSGSFPGLATDRTGLLISSLKIFKDAATSELEVTWIFGLNLDRSSMV